MGITELFSKRQKKLRGEMPDVYQYKEIPEKLRVQFIHIIRDVLSYKTNPNRALKIYSEVHKTLCKEFGVIRLGGLYESDEESIFKYLLEEENIEYCLDVFELFFKVIDSYSNKQRNAFIDSLQKPSNAINELNNRFKEEGVGFQLECGEIIQVDSQFIHGEVVKPVLHLLGSDPNYEGSFAEFLSAHEHYRHQRYKECLNDCLKAFESVMKSIHKKHSWDYKASDSSKNLINSCLTNNLIPQYLQTQFCSISTLLESGSATIRNKEGGHGQGAEVKEVPEHLASYALHLTASNLLFLIKCEENYGK
ncbi:hypothetical protein [Acinetobacter sp.]|uniref:STM4504/CBY_0614 family protein n=1 Tax=Acinetobacter sp. TaxID=472 RepID=UPI00333FBE4A